LSAAKNIQFELLCVAAELHLSFFFQVIVSVYLLFVVQLPWMPPIEYSMLQNAQVRDCGEGCAGTVDIGSLASKA
jgi:hypothetical protein